MNKLGLLFLIAVLFFLGKFAWSYVENGFSQMRGYNNQVQQEANDYQKRRDAETDQALGDHR